MAVNDERQFLTRKTRCYRPYATVSWAVFCNPGKLGEELAGRTGQIPACCPGRRRADPCQRCGSPPRLCASPSGPSRPSVPGAGPAPCVSMAARCPQRRRRRQLRRPPAFRRRFSRGRFPSDPTQGGVGGPLGLSSTPGRPAAGARSGTGGGGRSGAARRCWPQLEWMGCRPPRSLPSRSPPSLAGAFCA